MLVELRKSFTNYGPNKRRSCNWVVSHLRITEFYAKQTAPELEGTKPTDVDSHLPPSSPLRAYAVARKVADLHRRVNRMNAGSDHSLEQSPLHANYQVKSGGKVGVNSPPWGKKAH